MIEIQQVALGFNDGTIISASPVLEAEGSYPQRIVLRDLGDKYVVQNQSFSQTDYFSSYYSEGNHLYKYADPAGALAMAWGYFTQRTETLFGWND